MAGLKPIPAAPLTYEDFAIMTGAWLGRDWQRPLLYPIGHALESDRRDAALMLERQRHLAEPSGDGTTLENPVRMYQTVKSWWLLPLERHT